MKNTLLLFCAIILYASCAKNHLKDLGMEKASIHIDCGLSIDTRSTVSVVKTLHYFFINTLTEEVIEFVQYSSDDNFGKITEELEVGIYDCIVFGHNSETPTVSDMVISFEKVTESFYGVESFELSRGEVQQITIILDRINSRLETVSLEKLPEEAVSIELLLENVSNNINLLTGKPETLNSEFRNFVLRESDKGKENITFSINCFSDGKTNSTLYIKTYDKNKNIMRDIQSQPFIMQQNRITRLSGYLFISFALPDLSILFNQEWDGVDDIELP